MSVRKCKDRISGDVLEYFIMGEDEVPGWFGKPLANIAHGVYIVKRKGISYDFFSSKMFNERYDSISMEVPVKRCRDLSSGEVCEYFVMGIDERPEWYGNSDKWFSYDGGTILVYSELEDTIFKFSHDNTFSEKYEILDLGDQPTESEEDENGKHSVDLKNGNSIGHVNGRKCENIHTKCVYNFFIYGKDKTPSWFDYSKLSNFSKEWLEGEDDIYITDQKFDTINCILCYKEDFDNSYKELFPGTAEYGSMESNEGSACLVGGCGNKSAAARFCRCRNDHSVIHEYFIYGIDATPKWFKEIYIGCIGGYNFVTNNHITRRIKDGRISIITEKDFNHNFEDCQSDGTIERVVVDEEKDPPNLTQDWNGTESSYNWIKVVNSKGMDIIVVDDPKKLVINDGCSVAAGMKHSVADAMSNISEMAKDPNNWQEEVKENTVSDIDSAKLWFHGLPADVCKYLVLRHISISGTVDMVDLYHSQSF